MNPQSPIFPRYSLLAACALSFFLLLSCRSELSRKDAEVQQIIELCERYDTVPDLIHAGRLVDYMETRGDATRRQRAWRMMAKVYNRNHQPAFELQALHMAIGCVDMHQPYDTLEMARCYYDWSSQLHNAGHYEESLKKLAQARKMAETAHDTVTSYVWLGQSAWTFLEMRDTVRAWQASEPAYRYLWSRGERAKAVNARMPYFFMQSAYHPSDTLYLWLREYARYTDRDLTSPRSRDAVFYWRMMGDYHAFCGETDSAACYYRKMLQEYSPNNEAMAVGYRSLYGLYIITGKKDSADFYLQKYVSAYEHGRQQNVSNETEDLAHEYAQKHRFVERERENARRQQILTAFLLLVAAAMVFALLRYIFLRRHYNEVREQNREYAQIIESFNNKSAPQLFATDIARRFHELSSQDAHPSAEEWAELQRRIGEMYPDFFTNLSAQYAAQLPGQTLTEQERRIVSLIAIKCSPLQMSVLLVCGKSNISNLRRRLFKKITGQDGAGSNLDKLIGELCA